MFSGLDDPEVLAGRIAAVVVLALIVRLLWGAARGRQLDRLSIWCGASLLCFAWFLIWLITGGELPLGMPAFGLSIALLVVALSTPRPRKR